MNSRSLLIAGTWLASIVIAFSIGRLGTTETVTAGVNHPMSGEKLSPVEDQSKTDALVALMPMAFSEQPQGEKLKKVEDVIGAEPLEDWLKRLIKQDDEIVRTSAFLRLLEVLETPDDLRKALEIVSANGGRNVWRGAGMREASMLLQKWTLTDPKGAAAFAAGRSNEERWMASSVVLGTWARINPEEALAYAKSTGQVANSQDGNWSVATVVSQLAKSNVDRALQVAASEDVSRARGRMMDSVLSELFAQRGEDGARSAIMSLPSSTFRDNLTAQLAGRLADKDGPGTAQWVMSSLPAGDVRGRALAEVVNQWAGDDPVAAGNFLSRLPASSETDPARERYAYDVLRRDPEGALAWASTISADDQRTRAIENLVRAWMRRDKVAAEKWLVSAQLPESMRSQLLRN